MSDPETLARAVVSTGPLVLRSLAGFTDETRVTQAPGLPNHVIWTLGHLSLNEHRAAQRIGGAVSLPEADFYEGDGSGGDSERFDTESICFNSKPVARTEVYPSLARGIAIFDAANARLASVARSIDPEQIDAPVEWGSSPQGVSAADLIARMIFHNGTHTGQIIDLRRALGMPRII